MLIKEKQMEHFLPKAVQRKWARNESGLGICTLAIGQILFKRLVVQILLLESLW